MTEHFSPAEVAALLESSMTIIRAEVDALPKAVAIFHPAEVEWSINEVIGHLIEAERRGFAGRIKTLLATKDPQLEGWDQNEVTRGRRDDLKPTAKLVAEFERMRTESVTIVRGLKPGDLTRGGQHPKVGWLRVEDLLEEWVHHDRNHIRQILGNVQAWAWPHMGNAQKFSGE
ncbi:MAG TPA: DinB family protein [Candidatus Acidoferrales bacterium]|nr:DinB family protein [Candidatus Acidoferrales bacterium]